MIGSVGPGRWWNVRTGVLPAACDRSGDHGTHTPGPAGRARAKLVCRGPRAPAGGRHPARGGLFVDPFLPVGASRPDGCPDGRPRGHRRAVEGVEARPGQSAGPGRPDRPGPQRRHDGRHHRRVGHHRVDRRRQDDDHPRRPGPLHPGRLLGRTRRRDQRAGPGPPGHPAGRGVLRRALRTDGARLGVLLGSDPRSGHRSVPRRPGPLDRVAEGPSRPAVHRQRPGPLHRVRARHHGPVEPHGAETAGAARGHRPAHSPPNSR